MRFSSSSFLIVLGAILLIPCVDKVSGQVRKSASNHPNPAVQSPRETMALFLGAFIDRDLERLTVFLPGGESEAGLAFKKRMKEYYASFITEKRHIIRLLEIRVLSIKDDQGEKTASIETTFETSPDFKKKSSLNKEGIYTATYTWAFKQHRPGNPWLFDGGGF